MSCPKPITVEQAYQAYLSALELNGFTVIEKDGFYKIISLHSRSLGGIPVLTNQK